MSFGIPIRWRGMIAAMMLSATLTGCATFGMGTGARLVSTDAAQVPPASAAVIASDLVGRLAELVGPGTGTIHFQPDNSAFGLALESSLRGSGYAVAVGADAPGETPIRLTYVLDMFEGSVLARLSTDTVDLGRIYVLTATGATPSSPLSVMMRS